MIHMDRTGEKVKAHLTSLGLETPMVHSPYPHDLDKVNSISVSFKHVMSALGLDLNDDSLANTPHRVAKMFVHEYFYGLNYDNFPSVSMFDNKMHYDQMVLARGIRVHSVCEHHFVPFIGKATVGYFPSGKVVGLSKLNRVVEFFCKRPQVQERLTSQIHATLKFLLGTEDVAVVIEAEHFCVKIRGIQDECCDTVTSQISGKFKDQQTKGEFLLLLNGKK